VEDLSTGGGGACSVFTHIPYNKLTIIIDTEHRPGTRHSMLYVGALCLVFLLQHSHPQAAHKLHAYQYTVRIPTGSF
jgi:hypothetical protein